jgi:hypothetical protein
MHEAMATTRERSSARHALSNLFPPVVVYLQRAGSAHYQWSDALLVRTHLSNTQRVPACIDHHVQPRATYLFTFVRRRKSPLLQIFLDIELPALLRTAPGTSP